MADLDPWSPPESPEDQPPDTPKTVDTNTHWPLLGHKDQSKYLDVSTIVDASALFPFLYCP
ncbi:hypothetical protein [Prochlorococcus marinus]|uniref:hypothetical protein n=1 Tax=Prochlorococcus marinus TaxID=1219 RepID=UPI001F450DCA|nr:hypothetical protein [Prochlorococcus marinus]